ncbi:MAG: sugar phosphate isomerase/epimerase [Firmicutes bacterium]|nr:sugar phosphate isomerase/epimerase [Bacillota bacterium]
MNIPVALQLYTLREETEKDFIGTLEKVAAIGYQGVEFAGYGGLSASELKACLDRLGLKAAGSHVSMDQLTSNLDEVIAFNKAIGNAYIICPWAEFETKEDYINTAKKFNEIGQRCNENGLIFCYHNHDHEFDVVDGNYGLDILYGESAENLVKAEIDTYWVQYAGVDPVGYIKQYRGRCPLIHLKDMEAGEKKDYAEIGNGVMDIKAIVDAAKENGAKWLVVEQDECKRQPLESVTISFENLKKML